MKDEVVLVTESDEAIGSMDKLEAHKEAILHRAFSVFIYNSKGEMLLQQRAKNKYHSAGLWTNACCSHPRPGEDIFSAANRRLFEELGFTTLLKKEFEFTYKASFENGLTEYEYDHVFTGVFDGEVKPDKNEVSEFCFKSLDEIENDLQNSGKMYTEWFKIAFPKLVSRQYH
ncbi:MAG: isopentenyl-diphosphate delta-isomerase [Bacteroidetes bacterium]|nr:MAG: isopentenyl-diphosphate delta-isomerase [Bacteroidota bacterium]